MQEDGQVSIDFLVKRIQEVVTSTLDLKIPSSAIQPDEPLAALETTYEGVEYTFDSVDIVEVVTALEDAFEADFLEDEALHSLFAEGTLRDLAVFLADRFPVDALEKFCQDDA